MLHNIVGTCSLIFAVVSFASGAFAVDLRDATNQQILDELAYRLQTGSGGGGGGGGAAVNYLCDASYLNFSVIGPAGTEKSERIYLGDQNFCQQQVTVLVSNRSRISSTAVIAICDSSYMNRYSITPSGDLNALARQYFSDKESCFRQAKLVNGTM